MGNGGIRDQLGYNEHSDKVTVITRLIGSSMMVNTFNFSLWPGARWFEPCFQ